MPLFCRNTRLFGFVACLICLLFPSLNAQNIAIDGLLGDWKTADNIHTDPTEDGKGIDFKQCFISSDEEYVYIGFSMVRPLKLLETRDFFLYIDTDMNDKSGIAHDGLGAEIVINLGNRQVELSFGPMSNKFDVTDIGFVNAPTLASPNHEIAISRASLFPGKSFRLQFEDRDGGDLMPDVASQFVYEFPDTYPNPLDLIPLEKQAESYLRVMTFNIQEDGLLDENRRPAFQRIFTCANPDILILNECWNLSAAQVGEYFDQWLPMESQSWYTYKQDDGNIIASRFPLTNQWRVFEEGRISAFLIDLGPNYGTDIMLIGAHFACCANDAQRQKEADAVIQFILDARGPGGIVQLASNTPILVAGDLNLVGKSGQLKTLLNGTIKNASEFGLGSWPDWDNTAMEPVQARHSDSRMTYTWKSKNKDFPPGKLDYIIYSNSAINVHKAFTLNTSDMSSERLTQYGLKTGDSESASDHYPVIVDFLLTSFNFNQASGDFDKVFEMFRPPFEDKWTVRCKKAGYFPITAQLIDKDKNEILSSEGVSFFFLDVNGVEPGEYELQVTMDDKMYIKKVLKR